MSKVTIPGELELGTKRNTLSEETNLGIPFVLYGWKYNKQKKNKTN